MRVPDAEQLVQILDRAGPEITRNDGIDGLPGYTITRPYPRGHWNPLAMVHGARQVIGSLVLAEGSVIIQANTLSFAARHIHKLLQIYRPDMEIISVHYSSPNVR